jgi:hypothetical protein
LRWQDDFGKQVKSDSASSTRSKIYSLSRKYLYKSIDLSVDSQFCNTTAYGR